jgi:hypothetical protein
MSLSSRERGIAWYVDPIPSELQSSADDRSRLALTRACAASVPGQTPGSAGARSAAAAAAGVCAEGARESSRPGHACHLGMWQGMGHSLPYATRWPSTLAPRGQPSFKAA